MFTRLFASARDMYEGYIKLRCKMSELAELVPRELARIDAQLLRDSAKIDVRLSALEATLGGLSTKSATLELRLSAVEKRLDSSSTEDAIAELREQTRNLLELLIRQKADVDVATAQMCALKHMLSPHDQLALEQGHSVAVMPLANHKVITKAIIANPESTSNSSRKKPK